MQKTTHTPEPWTVDEELATVAGDTARVVSSNDQYDIVALVLGEDAEPRDSRARLIAEAPAMLEALRTLCDDLLTPASEWNKRKRIARALLAKIDGGTNDGDQ